MQKDTLGNISLFFSLDELKTANIISAALPKIQNCIEDNWDLDTSKPIKAYVMTSWQQFMFHSAPWPRKIYLGLFYPLVYLQVRRTWDIAGGYTLSSRIPVVGIKPYRLIKSADREIGQRIYALNETPIEVLHNIICHEFTHAYSSHLKLPMWLHEGLAMLTVDRFLGKDSIRRDTLEVMQAPFANRDPKTYRNLDYSNKDMVVYQIVRGYWLTRFLDETGFVDMKELLQKRISVRELESEIAEKLGLGLTTFWSEIDQMIVQHFK